LDQLASQGVQLWFEGSRLRFRGPRGALSTDQRTQLRERRDEVIAALRERAGAEVRIAPLSYGQRSLWFINQDQPGSAAYHVAAAVHVLSAIDRLALRDAFQALVDRHAILRTTYEIVDGQPSQRVAGAGVAVFEEHELPGLDDAALKARVQADYERPFDLREGPVLRTTLYSRAASDHVLLVTAHHIALDGRAMQLLWEELRALYVESLVGTPASLPRLDVQYTDYGDWQAKMLAGVEGEKLARYWLAKLAAPRAEVELPSDRHRPARKSVRGATFDFLLDEALTQRLGRLARTEGTTLFVVMLAAFKALLFRYTGTEDIVVGTPMLGRTRPEFGHVLGHFANPVPLRSRLDGQTSFRELAANLRQTLIEALEGQEYPLPLMVERLRPRRDPSRSPLFETMFALQRLDQLQTIDGQLPAGPQDASASFAGLKIRAYDLNRCEGQFDLSLELVDCGDTLDAAFKYNTDLYDGSTMRQLADHYCQLLRAIVERPQAQIGALPLLTPDERDRLLRATVEERIDSATVVARFERQVAETPLAPALRFEGCTLSYAELNARANKLGRRLRGIGVVPGVIVGLCLERSVDLVVALLAIQKAGGAYVPLDPAFPAERLSFMLSDSGAAVLVTAGGCAGGFEVHGSVQVLDLDVEAAALLSLDSTNLDGGAGGEDIAYVIYTSGSTGWPKGVAVSHQALSNFLWSMQREPGLSASDVLVAVTTISFDIAGLEIYLPLVVGARIELVTREAAADGHALAQRISECGGTVMQATPATWRLLIEVGWTAGDRRFRALCGGDVLSRDLADALLDRVGELWNMYGPTETTIWSTVERVDRGPITVGRPIANTDVYVVDKAGEPVPVGVVGEIWIGGEGVAMGYHRRPELTAERFLKDPFSERPGARVYRTGDLGRWRQDGRLEHLGRLDHQVKVRGFRIELGEIESVVCQLPQVREAIVLAAPAMAGETRLVAYVVGNVPVPTVSQLREHLRKSVPDYMMPAAFVFLDRLPLTDNGKVDRNALLVLDAAAIVTSEAYTAPGTEIEKGVAQIFAEVLDVHAVGMLDNFFELGGHSLLATRALARLRERFKLEIPLMALFQSPTVQGLSRWLEAAEKAVAPRQVTEPHLSPLPAWKCLVPTQSKGSRAPLFVIAGYMHADDTLRILSNLIPHLGPEQPLCGLRPRWLDGHTPEYSSVADVTDDYLLELRAFQPRGPYYLLGDCVGGVVAIEMARKLMDQGDEVALLMLLDTARPGYFSFLDRLFGRVTHIAGVLGQFVRPVEGTRRQVFFEVVQRKLRRARLSNSPITAADRIHEQRTAYQRLLKGHRLQPYPGPMTLILADDFYRFARFLGWNGFAEGGLEIARTPGTHETCRTEHVGELCQLLRRCLDRARLEREHRVADSGQNGQFTLQNPERAAQSPAAEHASKPPALKASRREAAALNAALSPAGQRAGSPNYTRIRLC
jgi:amino acid adenylation domain-containing protein